MTLESGAPEDATAAPLAVQFPDEIVFPGDTLRLDGVPMRSVVGTTVYALNKPAGVVTTMDDPQGRACVGDWLRDMPPGLFPVGRLDAETTGLLLLADDGDLAHLLLDPRYHAEKEYHLLVVGADISDADPRLTALLAGVMLDDGPAAALVAECIGSDGLNTRVRVVIAEGRKRIVRRMARAAGFVLLQLHRHRIGDLHLGPIPPGDARRLTPNEYAGLWSPWGGRAAVRDAQLGALRRRAERLNAEGRPFRRLNTWLTAYDAGA